MNVLLRGAQTARTAILRHTWRAANYLANRPLERRDDFNGQAAEATFTAEMPGARKGLDYSSPEAIFSNLTNDQLHAASTFLGAINGRTPNEAELDMFVGGMLGIQEDRDIEPVFLDLPDLDDPELNEYLSKYSEMWGVDARPPPRFLAELIVDQHHPGESFEPMTEAEHEQLQADIEAFKDKHGMSVHEMAARMTGAPIPEEPSDDAHDQYAVPEPRSPFD